MLDGGVPGKIFNVHKFGIGKFHRNDLVSTDTGAGGVLLSPNYLQSVFEIIARQKSFTILKKVNNTEDSYVKAQVGREGGRGGFALVFEGFFNDGAARYVQTVEFWSAEISYKTHVREKSVGDLSVFTFKTEKAELYPMSQTG